MQEASNLKMTKSKIHIQKSMTKTKTYNPLNICSKLKVSDKMQNIKTVISTGSFIVT